MEVKHFNKNKMKILSLALMMAAMADARRSRGKKEIHHDKNGITRGICTFNMDKETRDADSPKAWINLDEGKGDDLTHVQAFLGQVEDGTSYTLKLIDDDAENCQGTLITEVGSERGNSSGRASIINKNLGQPLSGDDSIVGAFLQVVSDGSEIGCCEILEYQDYWRKKQAQDGIDQ